MFWLLVFEQGMSRASRYRAQADLGRRLAEITVQPNVERELLGAGNHSAGWRWEGAAASNNDFAVIQEIARIAERGKFDLLFVSDGLDYEQGGSAYSCPQSGHCSSRTLTAQLGGEAAIGNQHQNRGTGDRSSSQTDI